MLIIGDDQACSGRQGTLYEKIVLRIAEKRPETESRHRLDRPVAECIEDEIDAFLVDPGVSEHARPFSSMTAGDAAKAISPASIRLNT
jgi:hypothetical protein